MSKDLEVLESLAKLEECAYAMKDLPMSNWIDLAENEAELDLKIMNWAEEIKFELFKGKQALQRLEAIDNAKPSEALKYVNGKIADLEDDLQHYTMVEKDKCKEFFIREDLKQFTTIKQALIKSQELEKENQELKETNMKYAKLIDDFQSKNMRLEKAIDILKGQFEFKFSDDIKIIYLFVKGIPLHIYSWVFKSQREYELAKEIFGESEWKMY